MESSEKLVRYNEYHKYISALPARVVLTKDEELDLGKKVKGGDLEAKRKLIENSYFLAMGLARRYYRGNENDILDLCQEGVIALIKSVDKFDYTRNCMLSTFSMPRIKQSISRAVHNDVLNYLPLRIPVHVHEHSSTIERFEKMYSYKHGVDPTDEEISIGTELSEARIRECRRANWIKENIAYLAIMHGESWSVERGNRATNIEELEYTSDLKISEYHNSEVSRIESSDTRDYLCKIVKQVSGERAWGILSLRFGLADGVDGVCHTLYEVGKEYGVTRERIRQIQAKTLRQIRGYFEENNLDSDNRLALGLNEYSS